MTSLVTAEAYLHHDNGPLHPERPNRLTAVVSELLREGLMPRLHRLAPRAATPDQIAYVHHRQYIDEVQRLAEAGGGSVDADTHVSSASYEVALLSAGGGLTAVDAVLDGKCDNAFVAHRPPGHHARPSHGMGFCLFNNVSIAARYAQRERGAERVFILDWDVHHGNGTQEAFYQDASVFFVSLHQSPWYPFTGEADERGEGPGDGTNLNLPLRAGRRNHEYLELLDTVVAPAVRAFQPDLFLLCAGQDIHERDPLGQMRVTSECFGTMTRRVLDWTAELCGNRLVVLLEGGYDLVGLAEGVRHVVGALLGEPEPTI